MIRYLPPRIRCLILAATASLATPCPAVIVAGVQGNGFNNAGISTLQPYLAFSGTPPFPYWNNLLRYSGASSIYLGYNPITLQGWVLSANHIGETSSITIQGHTYPFIDPLPFDANVNGHRIVHPASTPTDLILYTFSVAGSHPVPNLPSVPILASGPLAGEPLLMIGRGMRANAGTPSEDQTAPFSTSDPGTNDSFPFRWGTNRVDASGFVPSLNTSVFVTDFDDPALSGSDPFEGQAAVGDSGGAAFFLRNGTWQLSGTMLAVGDGPDADTTTNPAGFGDLTVFADLSLYATTIHTFTGTLVPEPSALTFSLACLPALLRRRRPAPRG